MKKVFVLFLPLLLIANSGCGTKTETQEAQGDITVQIPVRENNRSQLKVVTLKKIEDLRRVTGGYVSFFYSPKIEGNQMIGEVPHARFIKGSNGVFVPAESGAAELAAIYYHLQTLAEYDGQVGLGSVNQWPRRVAVSTRILGKGEFVTSNSFYDQGSDSMIFVDYSKDEQLPLSMNPGVIAHEHFHSIFSKLVIAPLVRAGRINESLKVSSHNNSFFAELLGLPEINVKFATNTDDNQALVQSINDFIMFKSLNEGLADYWGWVYSREDDYIRVSLPHVRSRSLEKPAMGFESPGRRKEKIQGLANVYAASENKSQVLDDIQAMGSVYAYAMGNQYARFFRSLNRTSTGEEFSTQQRNEFASRLIKLLHNLREELLTSDSKEAVEPEKIIEKFAELNPEVLADHCEKFKRVHREGMSCREAGNP